MPRIPPLLLKRIRKQNPSLSQLLPVCQTVDSARAELRWLQQHAIQQAEQRTSNPSITPQNLLQQYVNRRARGEPLQYILGSEFFGDLELKCRPGVLIPRQETASAITYLVRRILAQKPSNPFTAASDDKRNLRVLDLCTGSGCIPLIFQSEFLARRTWIRDLTLTAVDLSPLALSLATENFRLQRNASSQSLSAAQVLRTASIVRADILSPGAAALLPETDILLSNPPYISPRSYRSTTSRSVRRFEPQMALVPPPSPDHPQSYLPWSCSSASSSSSLDLPSPRSIRQEDTFYPVLLSHAVQLKARVFWLEVADFAQATRVAEMADRLGVWEGVEIWRDWLEEESDHHARGRNVAGEGGTSSIELAGGRIVEVRGVGSGRSVFGWRSEIGG
nr:mitochondrial n(5)-glutamine methyltransferase mtq1 [Quercus suber]